jgi:hypothetical protein
MVNVDGGNANAQLASAFQRLPAKLWRCIWLILLA